MRGELSSHAFCSAVLYVRLEATVDDSLLFTTPLLEWTTLRRDGLVAIQDAFGVSVEIRTFAQIAQLNDKDGPNEQSVLSTSATSLILSQQTTSLSSCRDRCLNSLWRVG